MGIRWDQDQGGTEVGPGWEKDQGGNRTGVGWGQGQTRFRPKLDQGVRPGLGPGLGGTNVRSM